MAGPCKGRVIQCQSTQLSSEQKVYTLWAYYSMSSRLMLQNNPPLALLDAWPQICILTSLASKSLVRKAQLKKTDGFVNEAALRGQGCLQSCGIGLSFEGGCERGMKEEVIGHSG